MNLEDHLIADFIMDLLLIYTVHHDLIKSKDHTANPSPPP